jgi:hypothetical protein
MRERWRTFKEGMEQVRKKIKAGCEKQNKK